MKMKTTIILLCALLSLTACAKESAKMAEVKAPMEQKAEPKAEKAETMPLGVRALMDAYPDFIKDFDGKNVVFADGTKMVYDDGRKKSFAVMLDDSDLEDMFYVAYEMPRDKAPDYQADAGRSRNDALFKKMYGSSSAAVQRTLTTVDWLGQKVKMTNVNGASDSLRKVAAELAARPELKKYLKSSGTFYWRPVRGAKRMSAHSYGIAFDIGVDYSDYWLWKNGNKADENAKVKYANRIPHEICEIFEKHGFIWGGAWYHFDTMHFEFRPEILRYAQLYKETNH